MNDIAIEAGTGGPCVAPLIVDKLSITFDAPHSVRKSIRAAIGTSGVHSFRSQNYRFSGRTYLNESLSFEGSRTTALVVQTDPRSPGKRSCRVEWNPSKTPADVVAQIGLHDIFGVPYDLLLPNGVITRCDLAVDVNGVSVDDLGVHMPRMRVSRNYLIGGTSRYLGGSDGAKYLVLYDKCAEVKKRNGKMPVHLHEPVPAPPVTRIEMRLKPNVPFAEMGEVPNPFAGVDIFDLKPGFGASGDGDPITTLCLRLARYEGLRGALNSLPKKLRPPVLKRLRAITKCTWWEPELIWKDHPAWVATLHNPFAAPVPSLVTVLPA